MPAEKTAIVTPEIQKQRISKSDSLILKNQKQELVHIGFDIIPIYMRS
jgi:hypothetical protein